MEKENVVSFGQLGLCPELLKAIADKGYVSPTPIQVKSIPEIIAGKDIIGGAQTGTGKTAAFTLPVLELLKRAGKPRKTPRVIVLVPTRELVVQVNGNIQDYGIELPFRTAAVYGGTKMRPQMNELSKGVDIVTATPGRLIDHVRQNSVDLSKVEIVVFDEADRMLDMGFVNDINKILEHIPEQRQNLLFSATYSKGVKRLIEGFTKRPEKIEVSPRNSAAKKIRQTVMPVPRACKPDLLSFLIKSEAWEQVLVFTRSKAGADDLVSHLCLCGIAATAIHKDKEQLNREQALADFKTGDISVLVATDIAARGLDINNLPYVVNFDLPDNPAMYVHRIGRTGRAGAKGQAISLFSQDEKKPLEKIERMLDWHIKRKVIRDFPRKSTPKPSNRRKKKKPNYKRNF